MDMEGKEKSCIIEKDKIDRLVYQYSYEPWFIRMIYKQYGEENGRKICDRGQVPEWTGCI